jgi:hypothetical protein
VTEAEWFDAKETWVLYISAKENGWLSDRKLRLWACTCCRRIWHLIVDECSRNAVEVAERFADGLINEDERKVVFAAAESVAFAIPSNAPPEHRVQRLSALSAAVAVADKPYYATETAQHAATLHERLSGKQEGAEAAAAEKLEQANLIRELLGNPFRPTAILPDWRTSTVLALARGIYEERAFDHMPILADALQDAGCDNEDILNHCRDAKRPHVRGCWVVDLILGKD